MSFNDFVLYKGLAIKQSTRVEAYHYIIKYGERSTWKDYIWLTPDRDAFWKAMYWSKRAEDLNLKLHARCYATDAAKTEWRRFLKEVNPIKPIEPMVPPLPD